MVVLVVSLACVAAAALAVLPRVLSGPREVSVTDILACVPLDIDYAKVEDPAVASCLEDALYASIEFQGVRGTDVLVAEAEKATPRMSLTCHSVLHSVGKRALPLVGDLGTAIPELPMNSCSNGLLHGFADQMALESPSDEVLRRQAEICQRDMGTRADICADALGHMFWTTRPVLPAAAERCAWFTDPNAVRYCTAGVIMRMVSPQPGSSTPMHTPQQIVDACRSWPVPGPDAGHGCALGVAYAEYETTAGSFKDELTRSRATAWTMPLSRLG